MGTRISQKVITLKVKKSFKFSLVTKVFGLFSSYINKGHARSISAKKNILAAFVIKGLNILISIILVPLTIHYVSTEKYGVWLTISSVISWFGFFDIGLTHGLRNKLSESFAKRKYKLARIYVSTSYAILSIVITSVFLIYVAIKPFLDWTKLLNVSADLSSDLNTVVFYVFVLFCLRFIFQIISTLLNADQKPSLSSFILLLGNAFSLLVIFLLEKISGGSLLYLSMALGGIPVVVLVLSSIYLFRYRYKNISPRISFVKFGFAGDIMNLGVKFFIISIGVILFYNINNLIIIKLFGPNEVTVYNIAYKYFNFVNMAFTIILTPFWSAFTEAYVNNDIGWIKRSIEKLQVIWIILSVFILILWLVSDYAYELWVGPEIIIPRMLSLSVAFYFIIITWQTIYIQFLNGIGKIKLQLFIVVGTSFVNLPLAIFMGKLYGVTGIMLSQIFFGSLTGIVLFVQYKKIINNSAKGVWIR